MAVVRFILGRKVLPATLKALPDDVFDVAHFAETSKGIKGPEKRYRAVLKFLGDQSDLHLGRTLLLSQAIETAWTTAKTTDPGDELEPKPEVDPHLYAGLTDEDLGLLPLMDVECRPIRWLWKYRLSMGNLALMAGDGGIGKSQVLLAIAAAVSIRGEWPSGEGLAPLGDVVIVSAEDRPDETIKPRLQAMGADLSRITGRWTRDVGG